MSDSYSSLRDLVGRLGRECPWTKAQRTHDMLYYTRKECLEVEEVLRSPQVDGVELTKEVCPRASRFPTAQRPLTGRCVPPPCSSAMYSLTCS
jgi:hypothetical protein